LLKQNGNIITEDKSKKKKTGKKKPVKKRGSKYEPKLKVDASFIDIIDLAMGKK
jgi:hypothetical protein